jgi:hypothetical protein
MNNYLPVDPDIDSDGNLVSLKSLFPNNTTAPIQLDPGQQKFSSSTVEFFTLSYSLSSSLKTSGMISSNSSLDSSVFINDIICYSESISPAPSNSLVLKTRWGFGLRIYCIVSNIKEKFELSIPAVAAAAEVGIANVSYKITGIGIGFEGFLTVLGSINPFGIMTIDVAAKISKTILDASQFSKTIKETQNRKERRTEFLKSLPLEVLLKDEVGVSKFSVPQSFVFGLRCIYQKIPLRDGLE